MRNKTTESEVTDARVGHERVSMRLSNLNPGEMVEHDEWEGLSETQQRDALFLRESRIRGRRFHEFWFAKYGPSNRDWIRGQKVYNDYVFRGWWRELKGQTLKLFSWIEKLVRAIFGR